MLLVTIGVVYGCVILDCIFRFNTKVSIIPNSASVS